MTTSPIPPRESLASLMCHDEFVARHLGTSDADQAAMLGLLGFGSRAALIDAVVPSGIRARAPLALPEAIGEAAALGRLRAIAAKNRPLKSFIGQGYHGTITPGVVLRNILENPAWYTAYTPYQPEISQGRLEALLNFQTMVCDLTGMAIANASMLDEATAAAEAMALCLRTGTHASRTFFVADDVLPQTLDVVRTRAAPIGVTVVTGPAEAAAGADAFAVLLQYPGADGEIRDLRPIVARVREGGGHAIVAADILALAPARRSASACRWAGAARTPAISPRATSSSARCRDASSASPSTPRAIPPTGSPCRRASSTSAARRRRPTSAPRRCCSP